MPCFVGTYVLYYAAHDKPLYNSCDSCSAHTECIGILFIGIFGMFLNDAYKLSLPAIFIYSIIYSITY